jgi:hypothetical protein
VNLQLIAALIGAASAASHYADALTTYEGIFKLGLTETVTTPFKSFFLKSPFRLIGLMPLPFVAYAVLAGIYGGENLATCLIFSAVNVASTYIGASNAIHNFQVNQTTKAKFVATVTK